MLVLMLIIAAASAAAFALAGAMDKRKVRKVLQQVAPAVGGVISGGKVIAAHGTTQYQCVYQPGDSDSSPSFTITVDCPSAGHFHVNRETGFDRWAKKTGLSQELQYGDPEFDKDFYIETETVDFAAAFFALPEKRQSIRDLFRLGCGSVSYDGKAMKATWTLARKGEQQEFSFIPSAVAALERLAKQLPVVYPAPNVGSRRLWKPKRQTAGIAVLSLSLAAPFVFGFGAAHFRPLDSWKVVVNSLPYSLLALALLLALLARLVRGEAWAHRVFLFTLVVGAVEVPFVGFEAEVFLNGWLDAGAPMSHRVAVIRTETEHSDSGDSYYAIVSSWRPEHSEEKIGIYSSLYQEMERRPHMGLIVVTKPGRFGFEWLVEYREVSKY